MRTSPAASTITILAISLYFTAAWGFDGLQALTSPNYGLDQVWRAQSVFSIGSLIGLGPLGLIKLAAFLGAVKLLAAVFCGLHILKRLRVIAGGTPDSEILEGALILVFALSVASATAATLSYNAELVGEQAVNLVLAAIAIALCMGERRRVEASEASELAVAAGDALPSRATWFSPWR